MVTDSDTFAVRAEEALTTQRGSNWLRVAGSRTDETGVPGVVRSGEHWEGVASEVGERGGRTGARVDRRSRAEGRVQRRLQGETAGACGHHENRQSREIRAKSLAETQGLGVPPGDGGRGGCKLPNLVECEEWPEREAAPDKVAGDAREGTTRATRDRG